MTNEELARDFKKVLVDWIASAGLMEHFLRAQLRVIERELSPPLVEKVYIKPEFRDKMVVRRRKMA